MNNLKKIIFYPERATKLPDLAVNNQNASWYLMLKVKQCVSLR